MMILESEDLKPGEKINEMFTCDGEDISPHLKWSNFPEETRSFALMLIDNDGKTGILSHWYVINIPKNVTEIHRGVPLPGDLIENDFMNLYYQGPCPERGTHTYTFKIFAIDKEKLENVNSIMFRKIMRKHSLDSAEISVTYEKKFNLKDFNFYSCHSCK